MDIKTLKVKHQELSDALDATNDNVKQHLDGLMEEIKKIEKEKAFDYGNSLGLVEGQEYFYLDSEGDVYRDEYSYENFEDNRRAELGNMFEKLDDAKSSFDFLKAKNSIANAVIKTGGSGELEWYIKAIHNTLTPSYACSAGSIPTNLTFKSEEAFQEAISEIGEGPFRTYLKGW
jgi:hypothetical protein